MHELSIVYGIITAVTDAAKKAKARQVTSVTLRLGALAGVVEDALQFSYDIATEETLLQGSTLVIHRLPVTIRCEVCQKDQELPGIQSFRCPVCDTPSYDIRQGRELELESLEIEEADDDANR